MSRAAERSGMLLQMSPGSFAPQTSVKWRHSEWSQGTENEGRQAREQNSIRKGMCVSLGLAKRVEANGLSYYVSPRSEGLERVGESRQ